MDRAPLNILGLICYQGHASAAALIRDGTVTDAVVADRFTRRKHDTDFPEAAVRHILERNGLSMEGISEIAFAWSPFKSLLGQLRQALSLGPSPWRYFAAKRPHHGGLSRLDKFLRMRGVREDILRRFGRCPPLSFVSHHLAHSYGAALEAPEQDGLLSIVADGAGEEASISAFEISQGRHRLLAETRFPHSLGILYSAVTQLLGFTPDRDEYKVMGLSAYGAEEPDPRLTEAMDSLARVSDARLRLDLRHIALHRSPDRFHAESLVKLLGGRGEDLPLERRAAIARALQGLLERRMSELVAQAAARCARPPRALCTSGGVFLNCLLNAHLRENSRPRFSDFHFSPVADDNGTALGAAALLFHRRSGRWPGPYRGLDLGPEYGEGRMLAALRGRPVRWIRPERPAREAAQRLAQGQVLGFFQGRSEFGPRALGFRSILADPRREDMKDRLNRKIKLREPFRPFAPSVLEERASEYFVLPGPTRLPFMIETVRAKPEAAAAVPAAVHVDGTARVQTVSRRDNPAFHDLLVEFDRLTGVPLLINTSFNLDGQPIVESPEDALECFLGSGLDALVLGPFLVEKAAAAR